jgi:uncharacterized protein (DUF1015 family)
MRQPEPRAAGGRAIGAGECGSRRYGQPVRNGELARYQLLAVERKLAVGRPPVDVALFPKEEPARICYPEVSLLPWPPSFPFNPTATPPRPGALQDLVTQPYDKISPEMRQRYLQASPYNLVRIILGERHESDSESDNVYTRAAHHLEDWTAQGILARDAEPALFAYFQEFTVPDSGERLVRKGFIGLGAVEEYSAGVVHRHEQTLSGPKKDRLELLRHTHAHFGQLFMLYPDPAGEIDRLLDEAAQAPPRAMSPTSMAPAIRSGRSRTPAASRIRQLMADKKLLIADGHHRYETALAFHRENPNCRARIA